MSNYAQILKNQEYLELIRKIENIKFITDGKWDWEHGLGHSKRVANYVERILKQLNVNKRTIDLGMTAALLHDIGLSNGTKNNHDFRSGEMFEKFLSNNDIIIEEKVTLKQAIVDHSNASNIKSIVGAVLALADKLDITYHRTENSSIQDKRNKEIQKIRNVDIKIDKQKMTIKYETKDSFNEKKLLDIFKDWNKPIIIPKKWQNI